MINVFFFKIFQLQLQLKIKESSLSYLSEKLIYKIDKNIDIYLLYRIIIIFKIILLMLDGIVSHLN
jgi:hypothetical protein